MAILYVRSTDGNNADDGSTWALAKATIAGAIAAASAGDTIYVSHQHAEDSAAAAISISGGTAASPIRIICANDGAEPPTALATSATVSTSSGSSAQNDINILGFLYVYGITFRSSISTTTNPNIILGTTLNSSNYVVLDNCTVSLYNCGTAARILFSSQASAAKDAGVELINTTLNFSNASQSVIPASNINWKGGSVTGTTPTTLFVGVSSFAPYGNVELYGVDLSNIGSGNNLVSVAGNGPGEFRFINCKLGASVTPVTGTHAGQGGRRVWLINCDSADTNYRYQKTDFLGTITSETTIVRTGGSSDGTTAFSRKVVTSANVDFTRPLVLDPIIVWNETTGSALTATVEIVTDNVTLTDAEAWLEVEYLGTSGYPLSLFANDRAADILATPANQTTSTETWTTTGLTTPVKQKLAVSFTPQEKGPIKLRVHVAKASTTVYVCQKAAVA